MKEKIKEAWNKFVAWWKANWKYIVTLGLKKIIEWINETNYNRKLKKVANEKKEAD